MSDPVAQFQTATRKGGRPLQIDDEVFTLKRATLAAADTLGKARGALAVNPDQFDADTIVAMLRPFVRESEWDRFHDLVLDMEAVDLRGLFDVISGNALEGVDPTVPASSAPSSSVTGGGSPDGASAEESPTPSVSV